MSLARLGFRCGGNFRNNLIIGDKNGIPPTKIEVSCDVERNLLDSMGGGAEDKGLMVKFNCEKLRLMFTKL